MPNTFKFDFELNQFQVPSMSSTLHRWKICILCTYWNSMSKNDITTIRFYLDKSTDIWLTVPSPPQTRIRRLGTLLYISNLKKRNRKCKRTRSKRRKKERMIYHLLPLSRTSLSEVEHLPGVQVPHERADDFRSLYRKGEEVLLCGCKVTFLCTRNFECRFWPGFRHSSDWQTPAEASWAEKESVAQKSASICHPAEDELLKSCHT